MGFKQFKKALHFSSVIEPLLWTVTAIGTERSVEEFSDGDSPNAFLELKILCAHTFIGFLRCIQTIHLKVLLLVKALSLF